MKSCQFKWVVIFWMLFLFRVSASVLYVDLNSANPTPPFSDWTIAATSIQDAIDASSDGDQILVTNGVYQTGGLVVYGSLTNRVVINKAVAVQSVNGPAVTLIQGYQVPGTITGDSAVRCVYMTNNAALIGFTLTNGATRSLNVAVTNLPVQGSGGGVWCESTKATISNCIIISNSCHGWGAGVYSGTLNNCSVIGNVNNVSPSSGGGGGAAFCILLDCTLSGNSLGDGDFGGGAYSCSLSNCILTANFGDGAYSCTLSHCTISSNVCLINGGGANLSLLDSCILNNNRATNNGGGAYNCTLNSCIVSNNWAGFQGGGIYASGGLGNTNIPGQSNTLVGNSANNLGGGLYLTIYTSGVTNWNLNDWIIVSNTTAKDGGGLYAASSQWILNNWTFSGNSAVGNGGGFCNPSGLTVASNCTFYDNIAGGNGGGAYGGNLNYCSLAGNQAGNNGGGVYGFLNNCMLAGNTASTNGGGAYFSGLTINSCTNCTFTNNLAANGGGVFCAVITAISNCVFSGNSAVTSGGGTWGGTVLNCLFVTNQAAQGGGVYNCAQCIGCSLNGNSATDSGGGVYVSTSTVFTNCQLWNNFAATNGGGAYGFGTFSRCTLLGNVAGANGGGIYVLSSVNITNCVLQNNSAGNNGGGTYQGQLRRCLLFGNVAKANGGGTYNANLANCLLTGNSAANGGGAYASGFSLNNSTIVGNTATNAGGGAYIQLGGTIASCIIYYNSAPNGTNYLALPSYSFSTLCTTPLPPSGSGNITNEPVFVNLAAGNFRLQTNSPCINVGGGSPGAIDLDGRPRVLGGRVDMGAYEFQGSGMGEFIAWLQQYGLPTDGSADYLDPDGDGMNNWQEWTAGTNPTNALSVLKLASAAPTNNPPGLVVTWQSVADINYLIERSSDLSAQPAFSSIQSNIIGQAGTTRYTDTTATNAGPYFYRVGVQ